MSNEKTTFDQLHEKEVQRMMAVIHLNELASKDDNIQNWLIAFYTDVLSYAQSHNISLSKINPNDVLTTVHNRITSKDGIQSNNFTDGDGIDADNSNGTISDI